MTTDKTGAPTTVTPGRDKFKIAVDGQTVGLLTFADRGDQRVFLHTQIDDKFEGRGLATILVKEALDSTRADGLRVVGVCKLVAGYLDKHHDFDDIRDPISDELEDWLLSS
jgi:predicted GNAT family acetyltransferase